MGLPMFLRKKSKVITFARMNPVTSGHQKVYEQLLSVAVIHKASHEIILSSKNHYQTDPLTPDQKLKHVKRAFPDTKITLAAKEAPSIIQHALLAYEQGYRHLHVIAGEDRTRAFEELLNKYNKKEYKFKTITVHKVHRGGGAISGTQMRQYAQINDFSTFNANLPTKIKMNPEYSAELFNDVKDGMKNERL